MFPGHRRISAERQYRRIFRDGRTIRSAALTARAQRSSTAQSRFGFVVSRAVAKQATIRNRLKRRLRAIAAALPNAAPAQDVIIIAHRSAATQSYAMLRREFQRLWHILTHDQDPRRHH